MTLLSPAAILAAEKFWILDPLYIALGTLLSWLYAVIPSYGVAIMLLTAAVSLLRMPLVAKQVKSQQEMQRIQPELKRIQAKYKAEPQKRNEELMKLYKEHNVNPFAGCLPLVLQMPLFIVLYRLILNLSAQPPKHIPKGSVLFRALSESGGKMRSFGMDLAQSASKVQGFGKLLPYAALIAVVVGTGLFQQRQMTARLPKDAINMQVQIMGKVFPVFLGFISFSIPAGVVLYFFVSNMWQIGQQAFLFRHQRPGGATPPAKDQKAEKAEKAEKAGGDAGAGGGAKGGPKAPAGKGGKPRAGGGAGGGGAAAAGGGRGGGGAGGGGRAKGTAPKGTRGPGGSVPRGTAKAGASGAEKNNAPASAGGGFIARFLKGPAGSVDGRANGKPRTKAGPKPAAKPAGKAGGRASGGRSRTGGARPGSNGRATPPRTSGRAQGKGQPGSRPKPRNTRKGK